MTAAQESKTRSRPASAQEPSRFAKNAGAGVALGLLALLTQIVLARELAPGEFGTLNALLGLTLILVAPLAALGLVLRHGVQPAEVAPLLNRAAVAWGIVCLVALFVVLPLLRLPRLSLQFYMLLAVGAAIFAICGRPATPARWCAVLGITAAVVRLLVSAWGGRDWPVAETGLGALILAGALAGLPALQDQPAPRRLRVIGAGLRPEFASALAALCLGVALALFTNADRVAVQPAFSAGDPQFIDYGRFDEYQAAGLLARSVLWGLLPLLIPLYRQRRALAKTTYASLRWLWIYLGALVLGSIALGFCGGLERTLFGGRPDVFLPGFAGAVFVLGLLQVIGVFALASRRHVECFVLGACSLAYTAVLFLVSNPQLLTTCMAGSALVALVVVLFVGVVRYARSHP